MGGGGVGEEVACEGVPEGDGVFCAGVDVELGPLELSLCLCLFAWISRRRGRGNL